MLATYCVIYDNKEDHFYRHKLSPHVTHRSFLPPPPFLVTFHASLHFIPLLLPEQQTTASVITFTNITYQHRQFHHFYEHHLLTWLCSILRLFLFTLEMKLIALATGQRGIDEMR